MGRHNEGTIYSKRRKRADGSTYLLYVVKVSLPDGRRLERATTDPRHAEAIRKEMLRLVGRAVEPRHRLTVGSFLAEWASGLRLGIQTVRRYRSVVDVHLVPGLGHFALQALRPSHVEAFLATRRPATAQQCRAVLRTSLNAAMRDRLVEFNAAELARPVKYQAEEAEVLSIDEARAFLEHVADDRLHALWLLACTTAMREGELLGLPWQSIDLKAGEIRITQQLIRAPGEWVVGPPKTRKSRRAIILSSVAQEALRAHRRRWVAEHGERIPEGEELVFQTERGLPLYGYRVVNLLRALLKAAGVTKPGLKLHELRHTAASFMVDDGIPEPVIRDYLGQSTVRLLMDRYAHTLPEQRRLVADAMEARFGG